MNRNCKFSELLMRVVWLNSLNSHVLFISTIIPLVSKKENCEFYFGIINELQFTHFWLKKTQANKKLITRVVEIYDPREVDDKPDAS